MKITDIPSAHTGQFPPGYAVKTAGLKNTSPQASLAPALERSTSALFAALGLPADRLSAVLVSFTQFFSLPLEPAALAKIRAQTGQAAQTAQDSPQSEQAAENREALSLAAVAAAAKGAALTREGLERYALALDPAAMTPADPDGGKGQGGGRNSGRRKQSAEGTAPLSADPVRLKERVLQSVKENPLLDILNRLPLKTGSQRWIALPFNFSQDGTQYRAALRILLNEGGGAAAVNHFALDIAVSGEPEQRRLFIVDAPGGENTRLRLLLRPALREQALEKLGRRLAEHIGLPPERVSARNWDESAAFADSRENPPRLINEEI